MPISNLTRITLTYHNMQDRWIDISRRRISAKLNIIAAGRVIPDPADLPIGHGRRLWGAVLFLDISGFTLRPSDTAEEQDAQVRVLSLFFSEMIKIVGDYGGTVEKNTGDGLMAYFVQSSGPGDIRHRAVACAMTMFHAANHFINPIIQRTGLAPIEFRVCIDSGWMTIARLGAAQRFNHIVAVGNVANRTSKMLRHAHPDDLLIGDATVGGCLKPGSTITLNPRALTPGGAIQTVQPTLFGNSTAAGRFLRGGREQEAIKIWIAL